MRNPDGPILVAWASKTGNTATLAQRIFEVLGREGLAAELVAAKDVDWDRLDRWSALVFGSPTYGSGDLHPDWDKPERRLRDLDLSGYPAAAFGCGNSRYVTPCWAVDILENRLKNGGARLVVPAYKADTLTGFRVRDADGWVEDLAASLDEFLDR
ncbi:MAG TPA: flavodoxin family protein [Spirochaetia bacterium]|jgi:flavodoxin I|nr:flavodoxin family protein [Spirochaetia bacterium]